MFVRFRTLAAALALALVATAATTGVARAQTVDPVDVGVVSSGHAKVRLTVTAGPAGAPGGFQVLWMTAADFAANGSAWPQSTVPGEGWNLFYGTATLNTWGSAGLPFVLAPDQSIDIEIGDTYDETGVSGTIRSELTDGTEYVFCAMALAADGITASPLSATRSQSTSSQGTGCTCTLGYWKTHTNNWPTSSLVLGTVTYTPAQLSSILNRSVSGNGLVSLAHQLIAAKMNIANGASPSAIATTLAAADALIGSRVIPPVGSGYLAPSATNALTQTLDDYNNGVSGPGHCSTTPARASSWGRLKAVYR